MTTFLLKTEPSEYSFDDLMREKKTVWDGVTNPAARAAMRTARKGDEALIYHTGDERRIVGLAKITCDAYPDPDEPGTTAKGEMKAPLFEVRALKRAKAPVTLDQIKSDVRFKGFRLLKEHRLSVVVVPQAMDAAIREMAGL